MKVTVFVFIFLFTVFTLLTKAAVNANTISISFEKLSKKKIVEFNNTNLDYTLQKSRDEFKTVADLLQFQLEILNLSARLQNIQAFEIILNQVPETFFYTKSFDFLYNISKFIVLNNDMEVYIDTILMLVKYQNKACDISQIYTGDIWITKSGRICFSMYSKYFTDDFLKHLYTILLSKSYLPILFIEEVLKQNADIMNYVLNVDVAFANVYQRFFLNLLL